jgi:hypothetical protein
MANSVRIVIGHWDYSPLVEFDSIHADNNIVMTSDVMDLNVSLTPGVDKVLNLNTNAMEIANRPLCGQEIIWENPNYLVKAPDGTMKPYREFAGVITEVEESINGTDLVYAIHTKSYVHFMDRRLVTAWYPQDAPENIIKNIVKQYAPTFTTYNVQSTNLTVVPQYYDYRPVSDSIKAIADQLEMGWYCDYYKDVHFYAAETFTSPLPNNTLHADTDFVNFGDLIIKENSQQQYNKIFIKGFKTRSDDLLFLPFTADAETVQWSLGYRVSSLKGDIEVQVYPDMATYKSDSNWFSGKVPLYGTKMTIKKDVIDGAPTQQGESNCAYIHYTQHLVRISNWNNSGQALPANYIVAVRFHYLKDMVFLAQDPAAQAETAKIEGTNGVYEYAVSDKSLTNSTLDAVKSKGQLLLMKYSSPQITGTFKTYFNATSKGGWRAGQYFTLQSANRFGGINDIMFVQRVNKSIVKNDSGGLVTLYNIEFADSPYLV